MSDIVDIWDDDEDRKQFTKAETTSDIREMAAVFGHVVQHYGNPAKAVYKQHKVIDAQTAEIDRLRAEVASLKEDNEQAYISLAIEGVRPSSLSDGIADLTQQLAAAKEYAERLIVALEEIADDSAHAAAQDALALPKPWDAIRKSEG